MITIEEAFRRVMEKTPRNEPHTVGLHEALGAVLAEDVASDVDMPPFDKAAMDGFAVIADDLAATPATLEVVEDIPAGAVPTRPVARGQCARIMTGAPVPRGADTVVRVEDTRPGPGPREVTILKPTPKGMNICWKAEDVATGDVVLPRGHVVRPPEIATLAACGRTSVSIYRRPSVAVLSTGDEVVPIEERPEAGQIRDANSHYVAARLRLLGIEARRLPIARDEPRALAEALRMGLESDVLVVSGGVSMGDYDFVPGVLADLGVEIHFKQVAMQPGRPTVFGTRDRKFLFGLPGNPVSVLVATELYVVPALKRMMGYAQVEPRRLTATLTEAARHRTGRVAHVPGLLSEEEGRRVVKPLPYHGSAHIHALTKANCLVVLPADEAVVEASREVQVVELFA